MRLLSNYFLNAILSDFFFLAVFPSEFGDLTSVIKDTSVTQNHWERNLYVDPGDECGDLVPGVDFAGAPVPCGKREVEGISEAVWGRLIWPSTNKEK